MVSIIPTITPSVSCLTPLLLLRTPDPNGLRLSPVALLIILLLLVVRIALTWYDFFRCDCFILLDKLGYGVVKRGSSWKE